MCGGKGEEGIALFATENRSLYTGKESESAARGEIRRSLFSTRVEKEDKSSRCCRLGRLPLPAQGEGKGLKRHRRLVPAGRSPFPSAQGRRADKRREGHRCLPVDGRFSSFCGGKEGNPSTLLGRLRLLSTQGWERGQRRCHCPTDGPFWQGGRGGTAKSAATRQMARLLPLAQGGWFVKGPPAVGQALHAL